MTWPPVNSTVSAGPGVVGAGGKSFVTVRSAWSPTLNTLAGHWKSTRTWCAATRAALVHEPID
jgi:hypothetical protein